MQAHRLSARLAAVHKRFVAQRQHVPRGVHVQIEVLVEAGIRQACRAYCRHHVGGARGREDVGGHAQAVVTVLTHEVHKRVLLCGRPRLACQAHARQLGDSLQRTQQKGAVRQGRRRGGGIQACQQASSKGQLWRTQPDSVAAPLIATSERTGRAVLLLASQPRRVI